MTLLIIPFDLRPTGQARHFHPAGPSVRPSVWPTGGGWRVFIEINWQHARHRLTVKALVLSSIVLDAQRTTGRTNGTGKWKRDAYATWRNILFFPFAFALRSGGGFWVFWQMALPLKLAERCFDVVGLGASMIECSLEGAPVRNLLFILDDV